jgi:hypothetical protein
LYDIEIFTAKKDYPTEKENEKIEKVKIIN